VAVNCQNLDGRQLFLLAILPVSSIAISARVRKLKSLQAPNKKCKILSGREKLIPIQMIISDPIEMLPFTAEHSSPLNQ
jgi:hypothetical protein